MRALRPGRRRAPRRTDEDFYRDLARSEVRHQELYLDLAGRYFAQDAVASRMDEILSIEARVLEALPVRAALY